VSTADVQPLPKAILLELLPAALEPWGSSALFSSRPPAETRIRRVEEAFKLKLPRVLLHVALACPSYGAWFGSMGEDFSSDNHMLEINRVFHNEGVPVRYVLLNHGHDGNCDAWDLEATPADGGEL